MTSSINPSNIDGTYPVAGQDNDSQGFRDNFTNTKNNFTYAKAEIEDLQNKVLVKEPLTGQTVDGNFNNLNTTYVIKNAIFQGEVLQIYDLGTVSGSNTVNFANGHWQTIDTSGALVLTFSGFTNGKAGVMVVEVTVNSVSDTVTFSDTLINETDLAYSDGAGVFTFDAIGTYYFEVSSTDAASYRVELLGHNRRNHQHSANLAIGSNLTAHTVDLTAAGNERTAIDANANVTVSYSATAVQGKEVKLFVNALAGLSVILPDTTNNLGANNFAVTSGVTASITFTAMDASNSNVYVTIATS